jgi:hypothetical protein
MSTDTGQCEHSLCDAVGGSTFHIVDMWSFEKKNKLRIIIPSKLIARINIGKYKHKLNILMSKRISNKLSINKHNYKNNYPYLTLGCKGHYFYH